MFVVSDCCSVINAYQTKYRLIARNFVCHAFEMKRESILIAGFLQAEKSFQIGMLSRPFETRPQDLHHPQILL